MPLANMCWPGFTLFEGFPATTSAAGTTITANVTTNTKGTTPTQLISSTAADSYGIYVHIDATASANATTDTLVDIMTGASSSEVVLIPDLMAGWQLNQNASNTLRTYYFPIFIPSGTRLSARSASVVSSKTCLVSLTLLQRPTRMNFVGTRVTAYGVTSSNSRGTDNTSGNNAYGTAVAVSGSTTNPIRYMQLGLSPGSRTTVTDQRVRAAIYLGASSLLVEDLQGSTDTGTESIGFEESNRLLQQLTWNLPSGQDLRVATMHNTTGASFSAIVYGVD